MGGYDLQLTSLKRFGEHIKHVRQQQMDALVNELRNRSAGEDGGKQQPAQPGVTGSKPTSEQLPFLGQGYMLNVLKQEEHAKLRQMRNQRRRANLSVRSPAAEPVVDKEVRKYNKNLTAQQLI